MSGFFQPPYCYANAQQQQQQLQPQYFTPPTPPPVVAPPAAAVCKLSYPPPRHHCYANAQQQPPHHQYPPPPPAPAPAVTEYKYPPPRAPCYPPQYPPPPAPVPAAVVEHHIYPPPPQPHCYANAHRQQQHHHQYPPPPPAPPRPAGIDPAYAQLLPILQQSRHGSINGGWTCGFCSSNNAFGYLPCGRCFNPPPQQSNDRRRTSQHRHQPTINKTGQHHPLNQTNNLPPQQPPTKPPAAVDQQSHHHAVPKRLHAAEAPPAAAPTTESSSSSSNGSSNGSISEFLRQCKTQPIATNVTPFECRICMESVPARGGLRLRGCGKVHWFCRGCLVKTISHSYDVLVRCPHISARSVSCEGRLLHCEVHDLLSAEAYGKYIETAKMMAEHENGAEVFHCRTPDCTGWWHSAAGAALPKYHTCLLCNKINCMTCEALHDEMYPDSYCKQYRETKNEQSGIKQTEQLLNELCTTDSAMRCPRCGIVIMKKISCDWVKCRICKTEICWVTRGPRWGPLGRGDTSGGCGCRVAGRKCHPKCRSCH